MNFTLWVFPTHFIYQYQSGFRSGYSTETCLIYLTDFIKHQISQGNYVGMMLLDVQKAFDSVNHDILCDKLEAMGISSGWFRSYLLNRKQLVCIDGIKSSLQTITCGVPQGSLLGPLLYLCYSNDDSVIIAYDRNLKVLPICSVLILLHAIIGWWTTNYLYMWARQNAFFLVPGLN